MIVKEENGEPACVEVASIPGRTEDGPGIDCLACAIYYPESG